MRFSVLVLFVSPPNTPCSGPAIQFGYVNEDCGTIADSRALVNITTTNATTTCVPSASRAATGPGAKRGRATGSVRRPAPRRGRLTVVSDGAAPGTLLVAGEVFRRHMVEEVLE